MSKFNLTSSASERANDVTPVSRHRSRSHRTHDNTRPSDTTNTSSSRSRIGVDFIRELTRERPPAASTPAPSTSQTQPSKRSHAQPPSLRREQADELLVDAIFSAHSDGLMVILRKSSVSSPTGSTLSNAPSLSTSSSSLSLSSATFSHARRSLPSQSSYTFPPPPPPPLSRRGDSSGSGSSSGSQTSGGRGGSYNPRPSYHPR